MSENITGREDRILDRDPLAPVTHGLASIADHHRFWLHPDSQEGASVSRKLPGLADLVVIADLPAHVEVDPGLRDRILPYSPMRSEIPLPSPDELSDYINFAYGQLDSPNPAPSHVWFSRPERHSK